jgi:peptidoglycan hydrolase-like protein with peptidoglycan-binding domain
MIMAILRFKDGLPSGRIWLGSVVKHLQQGLIAAGYNIVDDGQFGSKTRSAVKMFQIVNGLSDTGVVERSTWDALSPYLNEAIAENEKLVRELSESFGGDLDWVHVQEGHKGTPYWPGGASGITLDPGVDLGYADLILIEQLYSPLLTKNQLEAIRTVVGLKGADAQNALIANTNLQCIQIDQEQAEDLMPYAAQPYWNGIKNRFSSLNKPDALPSVQTALLSLAYNRGVNNTDLEQLRIPLEDGTWTDVANKIGAMQQDHELEAIRLRRQREAELIKAELEYLNS